MEVIFRISGDILISCIKGELDHHSAMPLRQAIDKSMKAFGCTNLIMDFSGVEFMDSSGIGVVLGRYKKMVKSGGKIYVSGCSDYIEKLLSMAGVFSIVPRADDFESAAALINGQEQISMEV